MSERILVFIPCYNCERQIPRVLEQFRDVTPGTFDEILVVDNQSRDGTVAAASAALPSTRIRGSVVRNLSNYNLGGSHKAAFGYAARNGFSHVVVLHGDDQGSIRDVLPLMRQGEHLRHDACLGARFMKGSRLLGYSRIRQYGNRVFDLLFSAAAGRRIYDLGSGLNIFGRSAFAVDPLMGFPDDLHFNVYLLLSLCDRRLRFMYFPISWREDDQVSNVKMFSQAMQTVGAAAEYAIRRARFRTSDHRSAPHAEYRFEVIARYEGATSS